MNDHPMSQLDFSPNLNAVGVRSRTAYLVVGVWVWLCFLESGVHATLAAVIMAFTIPARTRLDSRGLAAALQGLVHRYAALPLPDGYGLLRTDEQDVLHAHLGEVEGDARAHDPAPDDPDIGPPGQRGTVVVHQRHDVTCCFSHSHSIRQDPRIRHKPRW